MFPRYEEKFGKGAMQINVEQHELFIPKIEELEQYMKGVQEGKEKYDGQRIIDMIESFGDIMVQHLTDVGYFITSLLRFMSPSGVGNAECGSRSRSLYRKGAEADGQRFYENCTRGDRLLQEPSDGFGLHGSKQCMVSAALLRGLPLSH